MMTEGRLRCMGTSLFLKKRFGSGYVMKMAKRSEKCDVAKVTELVRSHVSEAQLISTVAGEFVYELPVAAVSTFGLMFENLRGQAKQLDIGAYGVSLTTLEQVFLRLARDTNSENDSNSDVDRTNIYFMDRMKNAYSRSCLFYRWLRSKFVCCAERKSLELDVVIPTNLANLVDLGYVAKVAEGKEAQEKEHFKPRLCCFLGRTSLCEACLKSDTSHPSTDVNKNVKMAASDVALNSEVQTIRTDMFATDSVDTIPALQPYATTVASTCVQLRELMRKRLIITLRDLKGFFFQILFPALQILIVFMILTININPVGKSLAMLASTIDSGAEVLYSGEAQYVAGGDFDPQKMSMVKSWAHDSDQLSRSVFLISMPGATITSLYCCNLISLLQCLIG